MGTLAQDNDVYKQIAGEAAASLKRITSLMTLKGLMKNNEDSTPTTPTSTETTTVSNNSPEQKAALDTTKQQAMQDAISFDVEDNGNPMLSQALAAKKQQEDLQKAQQEDQEAKTAAIAQAEEVEKQQQEQTIDAVVDDLMHQSVAPKPTIPTLTVTATSTTETTEEGESDAEKQARKEETKEEASRLWKGFTGTVGRATAEMAPIANSIWSHSLASRGKIDADSTYNVQNTILSGVESMVPDQYKGLFELGKAGLNGAAEAGLLGNFMNAGLAEKEGLTKAQTLGENLRALVPIGLQKTAKIQSAPDSLTERAAAVTGLNNDYQVAAASSGKRYSKRSAAAANNLIQQTESNLDTFSQEADLQTLREQNLENSIQLMESRKRHKYDPSGQFITMSKTGSKMPDKEELEAALQRRKQMRTQFTEENAEELFQLCTEAMEGKVTTLSSIKKYIEPRIEAIIKKYGDGSALLDYLEDLFEGDGEQAVAAIQSFLAKDLGKEVEAFQNGGSIMNPAGALHAHLNHIEDENEEVGSQLTQKGIPVVTTDADGEVSQVAEIERDELIFSKELTTKVEELWKKGTEEAMIEAGKLIAEALIEDSTDNTGLIDTIE